jgi:hypothetical protein
LVVLAGADVDRLRRGMELVGMLGSQTPGMRLTIWSTPVSGRAWICSRVISVVLTSSLSSAEPRPALTVMGGRLTGGGVSCAPANDGSNAAPANAAIRAAWMDGMKNSPSETNECDARKRVAVSGVRRGGVALAVGWARRGCPRA